MTKVPPPRAVFVDHPVGRTFGGPGDDQRHEEVLGAALAELSHFTEPGTIRDLHCRWDADDSRSWEKEVRALLLSDR